MPQKRSPRDGSMQYWPRKRAKKIYARVRSWTKSKEAKLLGFAGYKVGMTHLLINDNRKTSTTKGMDIFCPATIIECPPLKTLSLRFYKNTTNGLKLVSEQFGESFDKGLKRSMILPKKENARKSKILGSKASGTTNVVFGTNFVGKGQNKEIKNFPSDFDYIRLLVHTMPSLTCIGKKKPEVFEIAVGGSKDEQLNYAKSKFSKDITVSEVFRAGQQLDIHAVSKGKGVQGPVKRFGVSLRHHKSEKGVRRVGSLGGWKAQGHIMWRVAKAGKMGYHIRTEYNKWLLKIGNANEINKKGGFKNYGVVKNQYILVKGSVIGSKKRLIRLNESLRPNKIIPNEIPNIQYINLDQKAV